MASSHQRSVRPVSEITFFICISDLLSFSEYDLNEEVFKKFCKSVVSLARLSLKRREAGDIDIVELCSTFMAFWSRVLNSSGYNNTSIVQPVQRTHLARCGLPPN